MFELAVRAAVKGSTVEPDGSEHPTGEAGRDRDWRLVAALAAKKAHTAVAHGENAGETLEEAAVVRALSDRVLVPGQRGAAHIHLSKPSDLAWSDVELVVFAQSETTRGIGAVRAIDGQELPTR